MIRILRSSAFRIAIAFAIALTVTTYGVFALVYWRFYQSNVAVVRSVLEDEVRQTIDAPTDRVRHRLDLRLTQDLRHLDYVGLYAADGALLFGNVPKGLAVPVDGKAHLVQATPPQPDATQSESALFVAARRPDGGTLVLGRSLIYVAGLEAAMLHGFVVAIVPVVLIALGIGMLVSVRASRRLTSIQHAITRVMHGELQIRLPARGTPDDIDELCRAVNSMLDEIDRLIHQIKSVGDNIAHDLRAPLAVMRARLERGLAGGSEQTLRALTNEALGDLERAMTTVTALLRISELESGLRRGAFGAVDLAEVCRDAFDLYAPLGEARGLEMALAAPLPVIVTGDGDLLREALANLIDNAIKFTPDGGAVDVRCGLPSALVRVADTGPGVQTDEREKIVKRFYRAKATSDRPGAGLGLSMTSTIVELHGFGLRIADNAPVGAVFEIVGEPMVAAGKDAAATRPAPRRRDPPARAGQGVERLTS